MRFDDCHAPVGSANLGLPSFLLLRSRPLQFLAFFFRRCTDGDEGSREFTPPVSILKPVRGSDPDAYENFASFCRQDYPEYEILFCVDSPEDEIVPVLERLKLDHPHVQITVLFGSLRIAAN